MNLRFDLRSLQVFVSVAEYRNIARAAERHHIAPSAISKRIADLEAAVGVPLLVRQARGVEPTAAGLALLRHAKGIIRDVDRMQSELADYKGGARGFVRMYVNKSAIVQFLPEDLRRFGKIYPDIRIDLEEENSPAIIKAVLDDRAEIGIFTFGAGMSDIGDLVILPYRDDRLIVLVPGDHPLAERDSLTFPEVLPHDLIGLHAISAWNALLSQGAEAAGARLNVRYRVTSFDSVVKMAEAGLGIALVPSGVADLASHDLRRITLDEPWAARRLCIAAKSPDLLSPAARTLLDHLRAPHG